MHIAVSGEVDLGNAAVIESELRAALAHRPRAVSVDLTDLTYLDSTGNQGPCHARVCAQAVADHDEAHRAARFAYPPTDRAFGTRIAC